MSNEGGERLMSKISQKDRNPFLYSDSNKRYYTYDYYLKSTFDGSFFKDITVLAAIKVTSDKNTEVAPSGVKIPADLRGCR